jgi:hypothetical protein
MFLNTIFKTTFQNVYRFWSYYCIVLCLTTFSTIPYELHQLYLYTQYSFVLSCTVLVSTISFSKCVTSSLPTLMISSVTYVLGCSSTPCCVTVTLVLLGLSCSFLKTLRFRISSSSGVWDILVFLFPPFHLCLVYSQ